MKLPRLLLSSLAFAAATLAASAANPGFQPLFNGKDLSGWEGLKGYWSVKDGAIVGQTTAAAPLKGNTFLVYRGAEPANFELRVQFRLTPNNDKKWGNSGVQYRSRVIDAATFVVGGYQADIDSDGKYAGMLYEEKGRGILMGPGEKIRVGPVAAGKDGKKKAAVEKLGTPTTREQLTAAYKLGEWNELRIVAEGNHVQHFLNGTLSADVTDADPALAPKAGAVALQLHAGQPMTIEFRAVELKTLP